MNTFFKQLQEDFEKNHNPMKKEYKEVFDWLNSISIDDYNFQIKKKRAKHTIISEERCCAINNNGQQCSRRRQQHTLFCGTHNKKDTINTIKNEYTQPNMKKITIRKVNINGIIYYVDQQNIVYDHQDILKEYKKPKIIGNYNQEKHCIDFYKD